MTKARWSASIISRYLINERGGISIYRSNHKTDRGGHWFHGHGHGHRDIDLDKASLEELLIRSGYLAERKSGKYRGQRQILNILSGQPEISQKVLQERLEIEAGSLSELLAKLEEKGFLSRKRDEEDRRRMVVCLTEKGEEAVSRNAEDESGTDLFAALDETERRQLKEILEKLLRQWKAEREASRGKQAGGRENTEGKEKPEGYKGKH